MSRLIASVALLLTLLLPGAAAAQTFPKLTGRVVDEANLLPPADQAAIEAELAAIEQEIGPQLVVVTLPNLQGFTIEHFGLALGNSWGVGDRERDDGVLLIVALRERQVRIEVGRGLKTRLTDERCAEILAREIMPRVAEGQFVAGIAAGVAAIRAALAPERKDAAPEAERAPAAVTSS